MLKGPKLGILAGGGELPRLLIRACVDSNRPVFVIAFMDQCDPETVVGVDHAWVPIGKAGKSVKLLKANGVEQLVMAGKITKPSLLQLMPDAKTLKFIARGLMNQGDDGLLRAIVQEVEAKDGFTCIGVHEILPDLLTPTGVLGKVQPTKSDQIAIRSAVEAAVQLGANDLGQAAVATSQSIVALEERSGTDAMLKSLEGKAEAQGGVLAKMCKPGQEKRVDLPTIGIVTVENAVKAGLNGIVVEAKASLILDRAGVVQAADDAGLFLVGIKP